MHKPPLLPSTFFFFCLCFSFSFSALSLIESLDLPLAGSGNALQTGCIDVDLNKGYTVVNTSATGPVLLQFTLSPLSFGTSDYMFTPVSVSKSMGALIDVKKQILYLYGKNEFNLPLGSIAAVESFSIGNGTSLSSLSSFTTLTTDLDGFLSGFVRYNSGHFFGITQQNSDTVMYEINLAQSPAEVVHQSTLANPRPVDRAYVTSTFYYIGASGSSTVQYVFGSLGSYSTSNSPNSNNLDLDIVFGYPTLAAYSASFPWTWTTGSVLQSNATLYKIAACQDATSLVALIATCDPDTNLCLTFQIVTIDSNLVVSQNPILLKTIGVSHVDYLFPTIECVPGNNLVLVTLVNTLFKVDLTAGTFEKLTLPAYEYFSWCAAHPNGEIAYVGAVIRSDFTCQILQIGLS